MPTKTTLLHEINLVKKTIANDVQLYIPCKKITLENQIFNLLAKGRNATVPKGEARIRLVKQIYESISYGLTIPVSLAVLLGFRMPNNLKYKEPFGPPTYAWLHSLLVLGSIAARVKKVYPPGIQFYLFEEGYIFNNIFHIQEWIVNRNLRILKTFIDDLNIPVTVIHLLPEHFPKNDIEKIVIHDPTDAEVFAFLCSMPWMNDEEIIKSLYIACEKSFEAIRIHVGNDKWSNVKEDVRYKNKILAFRRHNSLYTRLIFDIHKNDVEGRLIDTSMTVKEGRICIRLTLDAFPNHGMPILDTIRCHCHIIPEYRIYEWLRSHPFNIEQRQINIDPVKINHSEFGEVCNQWTWVYHLSY